MSGPRPHGRSRGDILWPSAAGPEGLNLLAEWERFPQNNGGVLETIGPHGPLLCFRSASTFPMPGTGVALVMGGSGDGGRPLRSRLTNKRDECPPDG